MRQVLKGLDQSLDWKRARSVCGGRKQKGWSSSVCLWLKMARDEGGDGEVIPKAQRVRSL